MVEDRLSLSMSTSQHKLDHSLEKKAARSLFRRHKIFDFSKKAAISLLPDIKHDIQPFNSILRCQLIAESNRRTFYEAILKTGQAAVSSYVSLFKSDTEEEEVNNWGITKLRTATKTMSKYLAKDLQKEINLALKSSDKGKLKETYWRVYNLFEPEVEELEKHNF